MACSKNDSPPAKNIPPDIYHSPAVPEGGITVLKNKIRQQPYIGAGYDIMGSYLDNTSVKQQVIDLSKLDPDQIDNLAFRQSCSKDYEGRDATAFLKSIMTKNNFTLTGENSNDLLFTGTLTEGEGKFSSPYDYSAQYTFICEQSDNTALRRSIVLFSGKRLAPYVSDTFTEDVKTFTPQEIIKKYGTHVIRCAYLGNRIRNLYRTVVISSKDECLLAASYGAEARRQKIYKTAYDQSVPSAEVAKNYGGTTVVEFNGGDSEKLPDAVPDAPMDISAWMKSLLPSNYSLTTLSGNDLIPLYELITDKATGDKLKEATVAYIRSGQLSVLKTHPLLQVCKGNRYRYFNSVDDLLENAAEDDRAVGIIGSLFDGYQPGASALYLYSNTETDYLSFDSGLADKLQMDLKGEIGYCYAMRGDNLDTLYEITDGAHYAYTLENKIQYGEKGAWRKTGKEIYMKKVSL